MKPLHLYHSIAAVFFFMVSCNWSTIHTENNFENLLTYFSGVILSRRRCGGTGGGTCGGGKGDETLKASELLSEALLDNGLYVCVFAAGCA